MTLATLIEHGYYDGHGPGWAGPWLLFLWLIPLAIAVAAWRFGWGRRHAPVQDATSTLASRYARGEIDEDEYQQRLSVLRGERGES